MDFFGAVITEIDYILDSRRKRHIVGGLLTVLTVDEANKLYMSYLAEGNNSKCSQLQQLICEAKTTIRNTYPDDKEA